jgi:hypothetical protein
LTLLDRFPGFVTSVEIPVADIPEDDVGRFGLVAELLKRSRLYWEEWATQNNQ